MWGMVGIGLQQSEIESSEATRMLQEAQRGFELLEQERMRFQQEQETYVASCRTAEAQFADRYQGISALV